MMCFFRDVVFDNFQENCEIGESEFLSDELLCVLMKNYKIAVNPQSLGILRGFLEHT